MVAAPPTQKIPNQQAVFSGLDKITGRIISFDVALGETVQFGALQVVPRVCYTRPPTEAAATDAFVEVSEVTLQGEVRRIFSGWMFAASPGLNAVEHPIYDVWLTDCKQPTVKVARSNRRRHNSGCRVQRRSSRKSRSQQADRSAAPQQAAGAANASAAGAAARPAQQQPPARPRPQPQQGGSGWRRRTRSRRRSANRLDGAPSAASAAAPGSGSGSSAKKSASPSSARSSMRL